MSSCLSLFPEKKQGKESDALWAACKDQFESGMIQEKSVAQTTVNMYDMTKQEPVKKEYDAEGYKADWGTEHKSKEYPEKSEGLQHHPKYSGASTTSAAVAFVTMAAGALLL
jgi:hypothetical protein